MLKEVILRNFGLKVNPERRGIFDAVCFAHGVEIEHDFEAEGGTILLLDDDSTLEGFGERIKLLVVPLDGETIDRDSLKRLSQDVSSPD